VSWSSLLITSLPDSRQNYRRRHDVVVWDYDSTKCLCMVPNLSHDHGVSLDVGSDSLSTVLNHTHTR